MSELIQPNILKSTKKTSEKKNNKNEAITPFYKSFKRPNKFLNYSCVRTSDNIRPYIKRTRWTIGTQQGSRPICMTGPWFESKKFEIQPIRLFVKY